MSNDKTRENQDPIENLDDAPKEEEIRQSIIENYGLDELEQSDLIDKLVMDKLEEHKRLSTAIKQKITYRQKLEKAQQSLSEDEEKEQNKEDKPQKPPVDEITKTIQETIKQQLEERDISSLDLADELKQEIKDYAKMKDVSISEAVKSDYIQFRKQQIGKKIREQEASASSKNKTFIAEKDFSQTNPKDFNLKTEEGRKELAEYTEWLKSQD